ncbi:MAG: hypothetical protein ABEL04_09910 [Salinibacter sp.]|uniref:hypothetical protein n=1 Tax=Salinibacter sp. TaxID=2065818 RepID=UPI0035D3EBB2
MRALNRQQLAVETRRPFRTSPVAKQADPLVQCLGPIGRSERQLLPVRRERAPEQRRGPIVEGGEGKLPEGAVDQLREVTESYEAELRRLDAE